MTTRTTVKKETPARFRTHRHFPQKPDGSHDFTSLCLTASARTVGHKVVLPFSAPGPLQGPIWVYRPFGSRLPSSLLCTSCSFPACTPGLISPLTSGASPGVCLHLIANLMEEAQPLSKQPQTPTPSLDCRLWPVSSLGSACPPYGTLGKSLSISELRALMCELKIQTSALGGGGQT